MSLAYSFHSPPGISFASFHHLFSRMVGLLNTFTGRNQKLPLPPSVLWGITKSRTGRVFQKEQCFGGVRKVTGSPLLSFISEVPLQVLALHPWKHTPQKVSKKVSYLNKFLRRHRGPL